MRRTLEPGKSLLSLPMRSYEFYYKKARKYLVFLAKKHNVIVSGRAKFSKTYRHYIVISNGRLEPVEFRREGQTEEAYFETGEDNR